MSDLIIDFSSVPDFADKTFWLEFEDEAGQPLDFSGMTFEMRIGSARTGGDAPVTLTQADGDIVPSVVGGRTRLTWRFRPEKTGPLNGGEHRHDIIAFVGDRPTEFASGTLTIRQAVS